MSNIQACEHCHYDFLIEQDYCPHCGCPGLFPNVQRSNTSNEIQALENRYQSSRQDGKRRGCIGIFDDFEEAIQHSMAVINRSLNDFERIAKSDNELYATYYGLWGGNARFPEGEKWDRWRQLTDIELFGGKAKEEIRFAALSLNGMGLENYGDVTMVLKDEMISHRASVFEENSVLFMKHNQIDVWKEESIPSGYRASWENRFKLCIAKLGGKIENETEEEDFPDLLLKQGATTEDDEFVEVHIYRSFSRRSLKNIKLKEPKRPAAKDRVENLKQILDQVGVEIEVE